LRLAAKAAVFVEEESFWLSEASSKGWKCSATDTPYSLGLYYYLIEGVLIPRNQELLSSPTLEASDGQFRGDLLRAD